MDFALEIDWGSKIEQEFQGGSVSAVSAVLASPRHTVLCNALLCSVGRCPVSNRTRSRVPGRKRIFCTIHPTRGSVDIRICAVCKWSAVRQSPVSAGNKSRRIKVQGYLAGVLHC